MQQRGGKESGKRVWVPPGRQRHARAEQSKVNRCQEVGVVKSQLSALLWGVKVKATWAQKNAMPMQPGHTSALPVCLVSCLSVLSVSCLFFLPRRPSVCPLSSSRQRTSCHVCSKSRGYVWERCLKATQDMKETKCLHVQNSPLPASLNMHVGRHDVVLHNVKIGGVWIEEGLRWDT